jgi:hypothetical protein
MPEYNEYTRLLEMQERRRKLADDLIKQRWEIKAQTPEGRWAKVLVRLGYVMEDDEWRYTNAGVEPYDITRARPLDRIRWWRGIRATSRPIRSLNYGVDSEPAGSRRRVFLWFWLWAQRR